MSMPGSQLPFNSFARGVQAWAISFARGGTLEQAEAAASAASGGNFTPAMAEAAQAGLRAASGLIGGTPSERRDFHRDLAGALQPGDTEAVVTVHVSYRPIAWGPAEAALPDLWTTIQVHAPRGSNRAAIEAQVREDAALAAEGAESTYAGTVTGLDVLSVVGNA